MVIKILENTETHQERINLIKSAQKNILFITTHIHGDLLIEYLIIINDKLKLNPDIKIVMLFSNHKLNNKSIDLLKELFNTYYNSFSYLIDESFTCNKKIISNHVKCVIIDFGISYLIGGSVCDYSYLNDRNYIPKSVYNFIDNDFLFINEYNTNLFNICVIYMYQWLKIININNNLNLTLNSLNSISDSYMNTDTYMNITSYELDSYINIIYNNPLSNENSYYELIKKKLIECKKSVTICHMYFNLPDDLLNILKQKINDNVKVTIITSLPHDKSSIITYFYSINNKCKLFKLNNLHLNNYGYVQPYTTYHKKIIIIDDEIIAGNSNLGYKSFINSDFEINFVIPITKLTNDINTIIDNDIKYSIKYDKIKVSYYELFISWLYRKITNLVG